MLALPDAFIRQVSVTFPGGAAWLAGLPALLADCERRWGLTLGSPFPALSFNYAAPATLPDGTRVVLKAGVPRQEIASEIAALRLYDGRGSVRLIEGDAGRGLLLLERLLPGTMLVEVRDDEEATAIAARTMRALWRPAPDAHPFPTVADWFIGLRELRDEFGGGTGPFPTRLVEEAERLAADLLGTMAAPVVLHGDLHHYNILAAGREPWLAIDPKGVVGEPAYEIGALMRNPIGFPTTPGAQQILERRLDILSAALGFDRARLRAWTVAQAVLSAWWGYEDSGAFSPKWVTWAEALAALKE